MKKFLTLFLVSVFILSIICGCSQTPAETEGATEAATETETDAVTTEEVTTEPETETETEPVTYGEFIVEPEEDAELAVSRVYGDHMVLQRDAEITVWGTSNKEGSTVRGLFMDDEARGEVVDGKWEITFSPKPVSTEAQTLTIEDTCGSTVTFTDVLVGDVWVVSGQSNAEANAVFMPDLNVKTAAIADENKPLRVFQQGADYVIAHKKEPNEPQEDVFDPSCKWQVSDKQAARTCSVLGWFFGNRLADETGIPIGIVTMAANGAKINELMPKEMVDAYKYRMGGNVSPAQYYNTLIHPFLKMKFKAMVFFQGESESFNGANPTPKKYDRDINALFTELRNRWGFEFPVYNVQLSDYTSKALSSMQNTGYMRTQQYAAYKDMTGVRLIPSYDLGANEGYWNYMHSPFKKELADRIASLALADLYEIGSADDALAPEPEEVILSEDKTYITVKFKNVGEGLVSKSGDNTVNGFTLGQVNLPNKLNTVTAEIISADTVKISIPEGTTKLKGVGYACKPNVTADTVQLYNSNDLPALAFYHQF